MINTELNRHLVSGWLVFGIIYSYEHRKFQILFLFFLNSPHGLGLPFVLLLKESLVSWCYPNWKPLILFLEAYYHNSGGEWEKGHLFQSSDEIQLLKCMVSL